MAATNKRIVKFHPPNTKSCKLLKWKVHPGSRMTLGTILLLYEYLEPNSDNTSGQTLKLKAQSEGTVQALVARENDIIKPGCDLLELQSCLHSVVMKDLCAECGADLRQLGGDRLAEVVAETTFSMIHSVPELRVSQEQARKLGEADEERLLKSRKLVLLVDLDQTLIHTTNENIPPDMKGIFHFQLYGSRSPWYHTKFRPGTQEFLEKVSSLYELHIFTFGARPYAHHIASLMDPNGCFFSHRILSRDECLSANSKSGNLKVLFPCGDSMVCIIDDREDVWNYAPNVVQVKAYHFFSGTGDINTPTGLENTEIPSAKVKPPSNQSGAKHCPQVNNTKETKIEEPKPTLDDAKPNLGEAKPNLDTLGEAKLNLDVRKPNLDEAKPNLDEVKPNLDGTMTERDGSKPDLDEAKPDLDEAKLDLDEAMPNLEETNPTPSDRVDTTNSMSQNSDVIKTDEPETKENSDVNVKMSSGGEDFESLKESTIVGNGKSEDIGEAKSEERKENGHEKMIVEESTNADIVIGKIENGEDDSKDMETSDKSDEEEDSKSNVCSYVVEGVSEEDDYLMYLEEILTTIHQAFYDMYDQLQRHGKTIPDLKSVIPYVRRKILKGVNIVFSGVIPTTCDPEKSKMWSLAKAFGANITLDIFGPDSPYSTTHVIAARLGTAKVNKAKKMKGVHIVNPDWLTSCTERWERVDERLFPLTEEVVMRKPVRKSEMRDKMLMEFPPNVTYTGNAMRAVETPAEQCPVYDPITGKRVRVAAGQKSGFVPVVHVKNTRRKNLGTKMGPSDTFSNSLSPLLTFSSNEIEAMGREVDDACSEESENDADESTDSDNEGPQRKKEETSSEEGMNDGERPHGWKKRQKTEKEVEQKEEFGGVLDSEDENCVPKFPRSEIPVDSDRSEASDSEDMNESIGSVDEEMAAAVEREFLGS